MKRWPAGAVTEDYSFQVKAKAAGTLVMDVIVITLTPEGAMYSSVLSPDVELVVNFTYTPLCEQVNPRR